MILKVKRLNPNAKLPVRQHPGDLGFDLYARESVAVQAGQTVAVRTGIACEFPEGFGALIKERSSQAKAGIIVCGGVIDNGYRGELIVVLYNVNDPQGEGHIFYSQGAKIGQLLLVPVFPGDILEVETVNTTARGESGFGSTGK